MIRLKFQNCGHPNFSQEEQTTTDEPLEAIASRDKDAQLYIDYEGKLHRISDLQKVDYFMSSLWNFSILIESSCDVILPHKIWVTVFFIRFRILLSVVMGSWKRNVLVIFKSCEDNVFSKFMKRASYQEHTVFGQFLLNSLENCKGWVSFKLLLEKSKSTMTKILIYEKTLIT